MNNKEYSRKYYQKNRESLLEKKRIYYAENSEKFREQKLRWRNKTPIEKRQEINRRHAQKTRDNHSENWKKYHAEYMKEYYAKFPQNKLAHTIRIHGYCVLKSFLKIGDFPSRSNAQKLPYDLECVKNIVKVYGKVHELNQLKPRSHCCNHVVSIPWLLKFFKITKMNKITLEIWKVIWDSVNLSVCGKSTNSRKRNFINNDVIQTASILEAKHPIAKGLRAFLVAQI